MLLSKNYLDQKMNKYILSCIALVSAVNAVVIDTSADSNTKIDTGTKEEELLAPLQDYGPPKIEL